MTHAIRNDANALVPALQHAAAAPPAAQDPSEGATAATGETRDDTTAAPVPDDSPLLSPTHSWASVQPSACVAEWNYVLHCTPMQWEFPNIESTVIIASEDSVGSPLDRSPIAAASAGSMSSPLLPPVQSALHRTLSTAGGTDPSADASHTASPAVVLPAFSFAPTAAPPSTDATAPTSKPRPPPPRPKALNTDATATATPPLTSPTTTSMSTTTTAATAASAPVTTPPSAAAAAAAGPRASPSGSPNLHALALEGPRSSDDTKQLYKKDNRGLRFRSRQVTLQRQLFLQQRLLVSCLVFFAPTV